MRVVDIDAHNTLVIGGRAFSALSSIELKT